MTNKTEYAERPDVAVVEHRLDGKTCDLWVRRNIEEITREDDKLFIADEAYMQLDLEDCPAVEEVLAHVDEWYEIASEWQAPKEMTIAQLQAKIDYLEILIKER